MRASLRTAVWAATGALLLTGCEFNGLYDVPLPGGAAADGDAYHVTVEFRDVLDLVPQSAVKVNNVTVGSVEKIELRGWHARARLRIDDHVKLPANAVAGIRQTSMLGEKYVSLAKPSGVSPAGTLTDGARIPLSRSGRNPEIEEVLSALSALLNGGGVAQLHTITKELNNSLEGREDRVRSLLTELDTFIGSLDGQRNEIVRALKGLNKLGRTLRKEKTTITQAVESIPPGLKVLADQRKDLTKMLTALSRLGRTGTKVIKASHEDTVANLKNLQPILSELNRAGDDLPNALELMTTYPFPRNATSAIKGDYTNLHITADLDPESVYGNLDDNKKKPRDKPDLPDAPDIPDIPGVPDVPDAPDLPDTPDAPDGPDLPDGGGGDGGGDDGALCPPVCTSSHASYQGTAGAFPDGGWDEGVDRFLAELMMKGMPL